MTDPNSVTLWHAGETRLQQTVGVDQLLATHGHKRIRDFMPEQHRIFYGQLPFVLAGAVDPQGDVWATMLTGQPGFITSPHPRSLTIYSAPSLDDPASPGLEQNAAVGLLGIELHTRRRNRMNGRIAARAADHFTVAVEHAFGNCPQYIQLRDFEIIADHRPGTVQSLRGLDDPARALIRSSDTFFVASYTDDTPTGRQVDVSHRGGKAGFVRIDDGDALTIPDFSGNQQFNTLGNILINPKAGLIFADFATGDVLQLSGSAEIILDSPEIARFEGAERLWRFTPRRIIRRLATLPLRWKMRADGWSPMSLMTGDWNTAKAQEAPPA